MSNWLNLDTARFTTYGQIVRTPTATFPQTGTSALFTVHTGNVLMTSFLGIVTTATTTDPQITLGTHPTAGTLDVDGLATTTALTSTEVGTWIGLYGVTTTQVGGALVVGALAGSSMFMTPFTCPLAPGTVTITTGAGEAGAVTWYMTYIPLDEGAYVASLTG